ncbi:hypothetical protein BGZ52_002978 [Haplosporangium bisporale]|nr:hypothetical protein BGZ52_002978 [Haplosporangium bisporale]
MTQVKTPMQTKNKVLIEVVSVLVVVGVALDIYFCTKSDSDNKTGNTTNGASGPLPTPIVPSHGIGKGSTINGALFPYYVLTGETPAPVSVPGTVYTNYKIPNTFSISFDDGPFITIAASLVSSVSNSTAILPAVPLAAALRAAADPIFGLASLAFDLYAMLGEFAS